MAAIEILGLEKTYSVGFWRKRPKCALKPLQLTVEEGEIFGFLGPNGAGKTTTLKMLVGLAFPTGGTARILGMELDDPKMKAQIGFLPEQPYFYDYLTGRELLNYYGHLSGVDTKTLSGKVDNALARVGLKDAANVQLRKFSKGMLQRAGIAQAILHDPKVVFLDEPMSGLDPVGRREVRDIILELKNAGKTILFSTHILPDAEMLCDRVGVIAGGKLRGVGAPGAIVGVKATGMEILFELAEGVALPEKVRAQVTKSGAGYRMSISESELYAAMEELRVAGARITSLAQIKPTLEDFFMELVGQDRAQAAAVEVSGK